MSHRRSRVVLGAFIIVVFGLGFWIRALYFREWVRDPVAKVLVADEQWYWDSGSLIADGRSPTGAEPYYFGPLYSYALAPLIAAGTSHETIILLQHLLGMLNGVLIFLIGRRLFGSWAGAIAMALAVLSPVVVYYESFLLMETLLAFILLLSFLLLSSSTVLDHSTLSSARSYRLISPRLRTRRVFHVVLAGLLLGCAATGRPALIALPLAAAFWLYRTHQLRMGALLLFASACIVLLPIVRNLAVSGQFTPITTSGGFNLYLGNGPEATGTSIDISLFGPKQSWGGRSYAEGQTGRQLSATQTSSYWMKKALHHVWTQPQRALALTARKIQFLIGNEELPQIEWFEGDRRRFPALRMVPVPFAFILFFVVIGVWPASRTRAGWLVILYTVTIGGILVPFFITARFRVPWMPFLSLLAGSGAMALLRTWKSRRTREMGVMLAVGLVLTVISMHSRATLGQSALNSMFEARQAQKLAELGYRTQAIAGFQKALEIEPRNYWALIALGVQYSKDHRWNLADQSYRKALALTPDNAEALYGLGVALYRQGRSRDALDTLNRAATVWPYDARIAEYRGIVLDSLGRSSQANDAFQTALRLDGTRASAHQNYAAFLSLHGQLDGAIGHYRKALSLDPSNLLARRNLSIALLQSQRFAEARTVAAMLPTSDPVRASILAQADSLIGGHGDK